jgi:hypothetical protein
MVNDNSQLINQIGLCETHSLQHLIDALNVLSTETSGQFEPQGVSLIM